MSLRASAVLAVAIGRLPPLTGRTGGALSVVVEGITRGGVPRLDVTSVTRRAMWPETAPRLTVEEVIGIELKQ